MTTAGALRLLWFQLRRRPLSSLGSAASLGLALGVLMYFTSLALGIDALLSERVFPTDARLLTVTPPRLNLTGAVLDESAFARLRAIRGVKDAYRMMALRAPVLARTDGNFFGRGLNVAVDLMAVGVEYRYVAADISEKDFTDPPPDAPIPGLVARSLLDLYNQMFAPSRGLPRLSPELLTGFTFKMELGRSLVDKGKAIGEPLTARVVGVSSRAFFGGLTIPLATAQRLNRQLGVDAANYSNIVLELEQAKMRPAVIASVEALGFGYEDSPLGAQASTVVRIVSAAFLLLGLTLLLLAGASISRHISSSVMLRRRELTVFRILGATRSDIKALVFLEALTLGAVAALVGCVLALLGSYFTEAAAMRAGLTLARLTNPTALVFVCVIALGLITALLAAIGAARNAVRFSVTDALAEHTE